MSAVDASLHKMDRMRCTLPQILGREAINNLCFLTESSSREQGNAEAHWISIEEMHELIKDSACDIKAARLKNTETTEEKQRIESYDAEQLQQIYTLISPRDFSSLTGVFSPVYWP